MSIGFESPEVALRKLRVMLSQAKANIEHTFGERGVYWEECVHFAETEIARRGGVTR